jgi:transcriptional repressor NrdR
MTQKYRIGDTRVIESRELGDGTTIRRRRETLDGKHRFTTYERIEKPNLAIVKKDGSRELFDRNKLFGAIHRSVGKFLSSDLEVEEIVSIVEETLYADGESEVPSKRVGDLVLDELLRRNEVAYVRFASVYQEFKTVDEFKNALKKIEEQHSK